MPKWLGDTLGWLICIGAGLAERACGGEGFGGANGIGADTKFNASAVVLVIGFPAHCVVVWPKWLFVVLVKAGSGNCPVTNCKWLGAPNCSVALF